MKNELEAKRSIAYNHDFYDKKILNDCLNKFGYLLEYRKTMKSTMDFDFSKNDNSIIVLTDHQTCGRGRHANVWNDEKNKSVLMTVVEKDSEINNIPLGILSNVVALQICLVLEKITDCKKLSIKWPNDIMLEGKKVGGILLERKNQMTSIGLGLNIYENKKTPDRGYLLENNYLLNRKKILLAMMKQWTEFKKEFLQDFSEEKFLQLDELWKKNSYLLGKKIFLDLKNYSIIGTVIDCKLGEGLTVQSGEQEIKVSQDDYIPSSCIIV